MGKLKYFTLHDLKSCQNSWQVGYSGDFSDHWQGGFKITQKDAKRIIDNFKKSNKPILLDRDHNSLMGDSKAYGWFVDLEYVQNKFIGTVQLTSQGSKLVSDKSYKYLSPTYVLEGNNMIQDKQDAYIHSISLTNVPFLKQLPAIKNMQKQINPNKQEKKDMDTEQLVEILECSEDNILERIKELKDSIIEKDNIINDYSEQVIELKEKIAQIQDQKLDIQIDTFIKENKIPEDMTTQVRELYKISKQSVQELVKSLKSTVKDIPTQKIKENYNKEQINLDIYNVKTPQGVKRLKTLSETDPIRFDQIMEQLKNKRHEK